MSQAEAALDLVDIYRQRACQAEAAAEETADELAREVFMLVAVTWRELALQAAKLRRAQARAQAARS